MPNHFERRVTPPSTPTTVAGNPVAAMVRRQPGFLQGIGLRWRESQAQADVQKAAIDHVKREALATVAVAAQGQGELLRAEDGRLRAQVAAAIAIDLAANAGAASLELGNTRYGCSIANVRNRAAMLRSAAKLASAGDIDEQDAQALAGIAQDLHLEAERRMDAVYENACAMVERAYANALAQASVINRKEF